VPDHRGPALHRAIAGVATVGFAVAVAVLVASQLALLSVLDAARADRAADQIATSRFTADVIGDTVEQAVTPVVGPALARQLAVTTSSDEAVVDVVRDSLVATHRQLVDADADAGTRVDGNAAVDAVVARSILDQAAAAGLDVSALGLDPSQVRTTGLPIVGGVERIVPDDVPALGLRQVAETARILALVAMVVLGAVAVVVHPRPGRGTQQLGVAIVIVCGAWLAAMLVAGWVIELVSNTLFGEMLRTVWDDAVTRMLLLVGAGVLIGLGIAVAGAVLDAAGRRRRRPVR
jgi:hypothetical protein